MSRITISTLAALLLAAATIAGAAGTPEQQCQAGKSKAAGAYAACRQKAEAALATSGDVAKYGTALGKCETKMTTTWQKAIDKATNAGATCLDAPLTIGDFQTVIEACTNDLATALGGGGLPNCTVDLATVNAGSAVAADVLAGTTFSSGAGLELTGTMPDNGAVSITPSATTQAIAAGYHDGAGTVAGDANLVAANIKNGVSVFGVAGTAYPAQRLRTGQTAAIFGAGSDGVLQRGLVRSYTDNGDGTITDNNTGLMWEKKSDDGSVHDKDNTYLWSSYPSPYVYPWPMDGPLTTVFLATLNAGTGFAGYTDWRIPNVNELQSIVSYESGLSVDPSFNPTCFAGCTVTTCNCPRGNGGAAYNWSSTTYAGDPINAIAVSFAGGLVFKALKGADPYGARAVRGGS